MTQIHNNQVSSAQTSSRSCQIPTGPLPEILKPTHSTIKVLQSIGSEEVVNRPEETQEIILEQENNFESDSSNTFFEEGNGRVEHETIFWVDVKVAHQELDRSLLQNSVEHPFSTNPSHPRRTRPTYPPTPRRTPPKPRPFK